MLHARYKRELARMYSEGARDGMLEFIARLRGRRGPMMDGVGVVYEGPMPPELDQFLEHVDQAIGGTDPHEIADDVVSD